MAHGSNMFGPERRPPKNPKVRRMVRNINIAANAKLVAATAALGKNPK